MKVTVGHNSVGCNQWWILGWSFASQDCMFHVWGPCSGDLQLCWALEMALLLSPGETGLIQAVGLSLWKLVTATVSDWHHQLQEIQNVMWELGNVKCACQRWVLKPTNLHLRACACVHTALSAAALCNTFAGLHFPVDWKQSHSWFSPKISIWKCNFLELHGGSERPDLAVNNFLLSQTHRALLSTAFSL